MGLKPSTILKKFRLMTSRQPFPWLRSSWSASPPPPPPAFAISCPAAVVNAAVYMDLPSSSVTAPSFYMDVAPTDDGEDI